MGGLAIYLYYVAGQIEFHRRAATLGPDFWPKAILALIVATCVYEIVRVLVLRRRTHASGVLQDIVERSIQERGDARASAAPGEAHPLLLLAGIALTAAYVWVLPTTGFFLATAPYLAAFLAIGGYRRWGVNAALSVLGTLVIMFVFMKLVYVSLPIGEQPFAQVTFGLMKLMAIR